MAAKIILEVVKKEHVTQYVYFVTFKLITPATIAFHSGQNMMLMIAPGINRTMSIASPPQNNTELLMVHDIGPMGPGSKWTLELKVGDRATIVAPTGGALSLMDTPRKKILVATGTGVAPFHSMILDKPHVPMVLYWGLRFEQDRYWHQEFTTHAHNNANFSWHQVISRPTSSWQGLRGHVTEHIVELSDLILLEYYLCGNRKMIDELREKLIDLQVPKEQIKTELFY